MQERLKFVLYQRPLVTTAVLAGAVSARDVHCSKCFTVCHLCCYTAAVTYLNESRIPCAATLRWLGCTSLQLPSCCNLQAVVRQQGGWALLAKASEDSSTATDTRKINNKAWQTTGRSWSRQRHSVMCRWGLPPGQQNQRHCCNATLPWHMMQA